MNLRKLGSTTLYVLFLTAIVMAAGEIFARWKGFKPWETQQHKLEILPAGGIYKLHPERGYAGKPGQFTIRENDSVIFTVNRDAQGHRLTHLPTDTSTSKKPEIWIFGCSFTHGWGVNDQETYPWLLQNKLPQYEIVNFGMDGYSTLQSLMQLEEALASGARPQMAILAYGSFHDQRNVLSRAWEKSVGAFDVLDGVLYPYLRIDSVGQVVEGRSPLNYQPWPLQKTLAFVHFLETEDNYRQEKQMGANEITELLISRFLARCHQFQIQSLVAGIYQQERTTEVLAKIAAYRIPTIDLSLPPDEPMYRVSLSDGHPNKQAHEIYAQRLLEEILSLHPKSAP